MVPFTVLNANLDFSSKLLVEMKRFIWITKYLISTWLYILVEVLENICNYKSKVKNKLHSVYMFKILSTIDM